MTSILITTTKRNLFNCLIRSYHVSQTSVDISFYINATIKMKYKRLPNNFIVDRFRKFDEKDTSLRKANRWIGFECVHQID